MCDNTRFFVKALYSVCESTPACVCVKALCSLWKSWVEDQILGHLIFRTGFHLYWTIRKDSLWKHSILYESTLVFCVEKSLYIWFVCSILWEHILFFVNALWFECVRKHSSLCVWESTLILAKALYSLWKPSILCECTLVCVCVKTLWFVGVCDSTLFLVKALYSLWKHSVLCVRENIMIILFCVCVKALYSAWKHSVFCVWKHVCGK